MWGEKYKMIKYEDIVAIGKRMEDEESKFLFDLRIDYAFSRNKNMFDDSIVKRYTFDRIFEWERYIAGRDEKRKIVVWGTGHDGIITYKLLKDFGENIVAFGDGNSSKFNKCIIDGVCALSMDDILEKYSDAIIVIATRNYVSEVYEQLLVYGFDRKNVFYPKYKKLHGTRGKQYFDLANMKCEENEVFIDGGGLDGMNSVQFAQWSNNEYSEIYIFDPDKKCGEKIERNIEKYGLKNVTFIPKGLSDKDETLRFISDGMGSSTISDQGSDTVDVTSIDNVLKGRKATFIKMDIEGAEYAALIGAQETIKKWHPKLAICVYHKATDIIEIPKLILGMNPGYKLYLRHYTSCDWETVLYAY